MPRLRAPAALRKKLEAFPEQVARDPKSAALFLSPDADLVTSAGIVRGPDNVVEAAGDLFGQRASADIIAIRRPARRGAPTLVDSVFDTDDGRRGWVTEIWDNRGGGDLAIRSIRVRAGSPEAVFGNLHQLRPETVADEGVSDEVVAEEEEELRDKFQQFRDAFNAGDANGVVELFTSDSDAIVAFSFINGRGQILADRTAMGDKAERMAAGAAVINPNPLAVRQGAQIQDGEPKVIRFLSPTLAVVDGTAQIGNIPKAHGFSPREMQGVYTDVWTNASGEWQIAATRPWF